MKKLWARVGMTFEVDESNYNIIKNAIKNNDSKTVNDILFSGKHYFEGENYFPPDCDDNPNNKDFEF